MDIPLIGSLSVTVLLSIALVSPPLGVPLGWEISETEGLFLSMPEEVKRGTDSVVSERLNVFVLLMVTVSSPRETEEEIAPLVPATAKKP